MPWLIAALSLLCLASLHFWWRRRCNQLRQRAERAAAEREALQQALFNSMAEGVLILDDSERITIANQSVQRLFNVSGDLRGETIFKAFGNQPLVEMVKRLRD